MSTFQHFLLSITSIAAFVALIGLPVYQSLTDAITKIHALWGVL